jgi:hypothetical protein
MILPTQVHYEDFIGSHQKEAKGGIVQQIPPRVLIAAFPDASFRLQTPVESHSFTQTSKHNFSSFKNIVRMGSISPSNPPRSAVLSRRC